MKSRRVSEFYKNAFSTVLFGAGAVICSALITMNSSFGATQSRVATLSPRASVTQTRTSRANVASPRGGRVTQARSNQQNGRTVASRTAAIRPGNTRPAATAQSRASQNSAQSRANMGTRAVGNRTVTARPGTTVSRAGITPVRPGGTSQSRVATNNGARSATTGRTITTRPTTSARPSANARTITSRNNANVRASNTPARTVVARKSAAPSRVSVSRGNRITGSTTYLASVLNTGTYTNIIDSTTGNISTDAYDNCKSAYYACMDEICTARSAAQGRCACAARVRAFKQAEQALEKANEELITLSGELALLISTGGKDVSVAFQLTDAEKVMNCVSWKEMIAKNAKDSDVAKQWCTTHGIFDKENGGVVSSCDKPAYCSSDDNKFGFDIDTLNVSSGSDILIKLQSWADAKSATTDMLSSDNNTLLDRFNEVMDITSGMGNGEVGDDGTTAKDLDSLADTWGYDLFKMAHDDICGRVLDSCFNGMYETCGNLPDDTDDKGNKKYKCADGKSGGTCAYNYNSKIEIDENGDISLHERGTTSKDSSANASCFGYTTSSDPLYNLRGPVADARRSIMMKYLLDANAACDVYGEKLKTVAQNIGYQKTAAQQSLQQKRLEFANAEATTTSQAYQDAVANFSTCLSELYDCYTATARTNSSWSTARIKTYCATKANVAHCYETMICDKNALAVISLPDAVPVTGSQTSTGCTYSNDYKQNTCRNVVTLSEIMNGAASQGTQCTNGATNCDSAKMREYCMQTNHNIQAIREWNTGGTEWSTRNCGTNKHLEGTSCVSDVQSCTFDNAAEKHVARAEKTWNHTTATWGGCQIADCTPGYGPDYAGGACVPKQRECTSVAWPVHATAYNQYLNDGVYGACVVDSCDETFKPSADKKSCVCEDGLHLAKDAQSCKLTEECPADKMPTGATSAELLWDSNTNAWSTVCTILTCGDEGCECPDYQMFENGKCVDSQTACVGSGGTVDNGWCICSSASQNCDTLTTKSACESANATWVVECSCPDTLVQLSGIERCFNPQSTGDKKDVCLLTSGSWQNGACTCPEGYSLVPDLLGDGLDGCGGDMNAF